MNERVLFLLAYLEKGNLSTPIRSFLLVCKEIELSQWHFKFKNDSGRKKWQFLAKVFRHTSKCCVAEIQTIQLKNPGTLQRKSCGNESPGKKCFKIGECLMKLLLLFFNCGKTENSVPYATKGIGK